MIEEIMEARFVRFSRPLLIRMGRYKDDYYYQTTYGFWIPSDMNPDTAQLDSYCGYLCGLHCWGDGDNYFTVSFERRDVPDWVDKKGRVHIKQDKFMDRIGQKCMQKLGLTYNVLTVEVDDELLLDKYLNKYELLINEGFYWDLEALCIKEQEEELPF